MGGANVRRVVTVLASVAGISATVWGVRAFESQGASSMLPGLGSDVALLIPAATLVMIIAVAWLLLTKAAEHEQSPDLYVECGSCNRTILREWRLCPYCGSRVEHSRVEERSARPAS